MVRHARLPARARLLDSQYLLILVVTMVMVVFQYCFFERTLLGKKMQATSQDKEMATLLGIPVATMIMITFIYSSVLGGLAGILVAPILFVSVGMGSSIALKAFAASIIGGFGDVTGAIVGGLALGVVETFGAAYISVPYKDAFAFLVLLVFLCSGRRAFSAKGSRRKHERAQRQHAVDVPLPRPNRCCCGICRISSPRRSWSRSAATMRFDGYILNILMQATTYAIAVLGLSVVLGLCGQINLAQAAFFGFGAYAVGSAPPICI